MKPFIISEKTFKCHSRSWAMLSFVGSRGLYITDWKSRLHLFSDKNSLNDLEG